MASILQQPFDEFADPNTIALEYPLTTPIVNKNTINPAWDARVNAPCDRSPTISLEPSSTATQAVKELQRTVATDTPVSESVVAPNAAEPQVASKAPSNILHGRYLLDRAIAAGGSAVIYRARDLQRS